MDNIHFATLPNGKIVKVEFWGGTYCGINCFVSTRKIKFNLSDPSDIYGEKVSTL